MEGEGTAALRAVLRSGSAGAAATAPGAAKAEPAQRLRAAVEGECLQVQHVVYRFRCWSPARLGQVHSMQQARLSMQPRLSLINM